MIDLLVAKGFARLIEEDIRALTPDDARADPQENTDD